MDSARGTQGRSRPTALAALTVLLLQVVVLGNQWVNDQVFRHVVSQNGLLVYSAAAQSTWRIPRGGDNGYSLVADLRAVLLLLLAYVFVRVVARPPARPGGVFLSCWGAIILGAAAAGAVYGVAGRHFIGATGISVFVSVVQSMSAGAGYAVLGGWPAALLAAFVGRTRTSADLSEPGPASSDPAPDVEEPVQERDESGRSAG